MKIETCTISIDSKAELYDVETTCFDQDIVWCGSGRDHISVIVEEIKIEDEEMSIISSEYSELPHYTAKEFIKKFGGTTNHKQRYRIKTKEEFVEEFGENWRSEIELGFVNDMNFLFGRELTEDEKNRISTEDMTIRSDDSSISWSISEDMITEIKREKVKQKAKWNIIDKIVPKTQRVTLSDSLYRRKKVNLNQNN